MEKHTNTLGGLCMPFYKFIKIKGADIGYSVPRMYKLPFTWYELRIVGLQFVKDRLAGWTIFWVANPIDFILAIKILDELKKTTTLEYKVGEFF
jgi:hypothetical protein